MKIRKSGYEFFEKVIEKMKKKVKKKSKKDILKKQGVIRKKED